MSKFSIKISIEKETLNNIYLDKCFKYSYACNIIYNNYYFYDK